MGRANYYRQWEEHRKENRYFAALFQGNPTKYAGVQLAWARQWWKDNMGPSIQAQPAVPTVARKPLTAETRTPAAPVKRTA